MQVVPVVGRYSDFDPIACTCSSALAADSLTRAASRYSPVRMYMCAGMCTRCPAEGASVSSPSQSPFGEHSCDSRRNVSAFNCRGHLLLPSSGSSSRGPALKRVRRLRPLGRRRAFQEYRFQIASEAKGIFDQWRRVCSSSSVRFSDSSFSPASASFPAAVSF